MITEYDEGKGFVRVYWKDIRNRVKRVDPKVTKIIDALSPDQNFPLYLSYLPYGHLKGDPFSSFLSMADGSSIRLSDPSVPNEIKKNLWYGLDTSPLSLLLEKEIEFFLDLKDRKITVPWVIIKEGTFLSTRRALKRHAPNRKYVPTNILTASSGARSIFSLPSLGCTVNYNRLKSFLNIRSPIPKNLYDHWYLFKEISNTALKDQINWQSCVLYFSQSWIDKLHQDPAWSALKLYLLEKAFVYFERESIRIFYDIAFSLMQRKRNLKPNPYLVDTAKHLFATAMGEAPGYAPALNENSAPIHSLQKVIVDFFGLKKHIPSIMKPEHFEPNNPASMVYYSMQHPATFTFSPSSRNSSSTLLEMRELQHLIHVLKKELNDKNSLYQETDLGQISRESEFIYFHNKYDRHQVITQSSEIINHDGRFEHAHTQHPEAKFACDAPFMRGCILIKNKDKSIN